MKPEGTATESQQPATHYEVEVKAMQDICSALIPLTEEARARVISYASRYFKIYDSRF